MSAPEKLNTEIISTVIGLIFVLIGLFIGIPTFEEAFNIVLINYLFPLVSGIIAGVTLHIVLKK